MKNNPITIPNEALQNSPLPPVSSSGGAYIKKMKTEKICITCGIKFNSFSKRTTCSPNCYNKIKNKIEKISKKCIICGKIFYVYNTSTRTTCSTRCYYKTHYKKCGNKHKHDKEHKIFRTVFKKGVITKTCCYFCNNEKVEAHHPDYSKPLNIVWLCLSHHRKLHQIMNITKV